VLQEAVSAQEFADFDLQELAALLAKASRGRFGLEKAEKLQQQARLSIGVAFLVDVVRIEMDCLLAQINLLEEQRSRVDQAIAELMQQIPQHITSIPGISPVTGAAILAEIGDVHRFETLDKLVAYVGIDATIYQTGQFEASEAHMSKRGSPYLRQALWMAAVAGLLHDPSLKAYYQKKRDEGKHHGTAVGAVCHKLLARIYVILKEQRPYDIR
jgi:transposase